MSTFTPDAAAALAGADWLRARRAAAAEAFAEATLPTTDEEWRVRLSPDEAKVLAMGDPVITVYPADAAATGRSVPETARQVLTAIQKALWKEQIDLTF